MFSLTTWFDALVPASIRQMSQGQELPASVAFAVGFGHFRVTLLSNPSGVARRRCSGFSSRLLHPQRSSTLSGSAGLAWGGKKLLNSAIWGVLSGYRLSSLPWLSSEEGNLDGFFSRIVNEV